MIFMRVLVAISVRWCKAGGVGQAPSARDKINIPQYSVQGYTRSMRKQQTSNSSSAEVCRGALGRSCSIEFLPDAKHLSRVEKPAFADILGKAAWSPT